MVVNFLFNIYLLPATINNEHTAFLTRLISTHFHSITDLCKHRRVALSLGWRHHLAISICSRNILLLAYCKVRPAVRWLIPWSKWSLHISTLHHRLCHYSGLLPFVLRFIFCNSEGAIKGAFRFCRYTFWAFGLVFNYQLTSLPILGLIVHTRTRVFFVFLDSCNFRTSFIAFSSA